MFPKNGLYFHLFLSNCLYAGGFENFAQGSDHCYTQTRGRSENGVVLAKWNKTGEDFRLIVFKINLPENGEDSQWYE